MTLATYTTGWTILWLKVCYERAVYHIDGYFVVIEVEFVNWNRRNFICGA